MLAAREQLSMHATRGAALQHIRCAVKAFAQTAAEQQRRASGTLLLLNFAQSAATLRASYGATAALKKVGEQLGSNVPVSRHAPRG